MGRNPRKTWLSDTKSFEKHCCKHRRREAGGWGGPSTSNDAGGGGASPKSPSRALMRQRTRNNADTEEWRVGDLLQKLLPPVGRSGVDEPSGVVAGRS